MKTNKNIMMVKKIIYPFAYLTEAILLAFAFVGFVIVTLCDSLAKMLPDREWYSKEVK